MMFAIIIHKTIKLYNISQHIFIFSYFIFSLFIWNGIVRMSEHTQSWQYPQRIRFIRRIAAEEEMEILGQMYNRRCFASSRERSIGR